MNRRGKLSRSEQILDQKVKNEENAVMCYVNNGISEF